MKILIAPMAALAETSGPITRARASAVKAKERGHEVALCAAEDRNYSPVDNVNNYYAPVPIVSRFRSPMPPIRNTVKGSKNS
jgi:hypothetical protein